MTELKPCPFCGEKPQVTSCDRLITISCNTCQYHRWFHGLVQSEIDTGIPVHYDNGKISETEWYDQFAMEKAVEAWNRRADDV